MKPVCKGVPVLGFSKHGDAKPELAKRMGEFCSYCEKALEVKALHVEHIYPDKAHPETRRSWLNFLLACSTCNTYKRHHLGDGRQKGLKRRFLWPHIDNTFSAYAYDNLGRVSVNLPAGTAQAVVDAAQGTLDMVGSLSSPAVAATYQALGIAYDGVTKRSEAWSTAQLFLRLYIANPTPDQVLATITMVNKMGYFSIWMVVFQVYPAVRNELIKACKADPDCFDATTTDPKPKGRA